MTFLSIKSQDVSLNVMHRWKFLIKEFLPWVAISVFPYIPFPSLFNSFLFVLSLSSSFLHFPPLPFSFFLFPPHPFTFLLFHFHSFPSISSPTLPFTPPYSCLPFTVLPSFHSFLFLFYSTSWIISDRNVLFFMKKLRFSALIFLDV